jgi:hypothetical protein
MRRYEMVEVKCHTCGKMFNRISKEVNRSIRLGRRQFCSRTCCGKGTNDKESLMKRIPLEKRLTAWQYIRHRRTVGKNSPFKYFLKTINGHSRQYDVDVDLLHLIEVWEKQKGICPFTGWTLNLPYGSVGCRDTQKNSRRASVDRIDNSKGYIKGNIRFISVMANYARNNMSDEELIEFCKAVVYNNIGTE